MCYQDWQTTAEWINFTCQEHKAHLLRTQGIMFISTEEYYAMQHAQPMKWFIYMYHGLFLCTMYDSYGLELCSMYDSHDVYLRVL
jgi:hypothetical protein